jgi:parallel beta-helix repeat protein
MTVHMTGSRPTFTRGPLVLRLLLLAVLAAVFLGLQARFSTSTYALSIVVNSLADTAHIADDATGGGVAADAIRNGTETIPTVCGTTGTAAAPTGLCTLRAAVYMTNANGDTTDTITFDATLSGTITLGALTLPLGPCGTITVASCGTNTVVNSTTIDGLTASTTNPDPVITVDCGGVTPTAAFTVTGVSNTIRDLNIVDCDTAAIEITGEPADSNNVRGNYIGITAGGTACGTGNFDGVLITDGDSNTVGGTAAADRNVISCNDDDGIDVSGAATANIVRNNYIGSDDLGGGSGTLGNGDDGIVDTSSSNTDIFDNVIVSNADDGIRLEGTTGAEVLGNKIGVAADGTTALGNSDDGVSSSGGGSNIIGGSRAGTACANPCNIIAFNSDDGVQLSNSNSNTVAGNYIGTDASGTADAGNADNGVFVRGSSSGNTIGGSRTVTTQCSGPCNVIIGNGGDGVFFDNSATNNTVRGNNIGQGVDGLSAQPNDDDGVDDSSDNGAATGNRVGGTGASPTSAGFCTGDCNIIASNGSAGVAVEATGDTRTSIRGNRMFLNDDLGIDLDDDTVVDCTTATANGGIDCPDITGVVFTSSLFRVSGSCANAGAIIDIYQVGSQEDLSGFGEGLTWLGSGPCSLPGPVFSIDVCTTGPTSFTATETATLSAPATSEFAENEDSPAGSCILAPPATATLTRTPTSTPGGGTATPTRTATPTVTSTPTVTNTPTITLTPTVTNTPTNTPVPPTVTNTPVPPTATRTSTPITPTPAKDCGDVNDDGRVNSIDAIFVLQLDADLVSSLRNEPSADVNNDGGINSVDAALILQKEAALIPESALDCG